MYYSYISPPNISRFYSIPLFCPCPSLPPPVPAASPLMFRSMQAGRGGREHRLDTSTGTSLKAHSAAKRL